MTQAHTPAAGLAIGLALGIVVARWAGYPVVPTGWAAASLLVPACFLFLGRRVPFGLFYLLCCLCSLLLGCCLAGRLHPPNQESHYSRLRLKTPKPLLLELTEPLPSGYYTRWMAEFIRADSAFAKGKVLLEVPKTMATQHWQPADRIALTGLSQPFTPPLNPWTFNYRNYMHTQGVWGRIRSDSASLHHFTIPRPGLAGKAARLRARLSGILEHPNLEPATQGLLKALLLGNRNALSPEQKKAFQNSGAAHLLAVSGLHVGILTGILGLILRPLHLVPGGRILHLAAILGFLWGYALLAGLSPSVVRASVMFSLLAIALHAGRSHQSLHFLCLAAIFLMVLEPCVLFTPGFQLSFAAVWAILFYMPPFLQAWPLQKSWGRRLGQWCGLSLSAQLGVLPITLYYFHTFPGLFLLTNLVLVPVMGILLMAGFLLLGILALGQAQEGVITLGNGLFGAFQSTVTFLGSLDGTVIRDIRWGPADLTLTMGAILLGGYAFRIRQWRLLAGAALLLLIRSGMAVRTAQQTANTSEWVVPHRTGFSGFWIRQGSTAFTFADTTADIQYLLQEYAVAEGVRKVHPQALGNAYRLSGFRMVRLDSTGKYAPGAGAAQILLLSGSPKIRLETVLDTLSPCMVIADGSNYYSRVALWRELCLERGIRFHHTGSEGAFRLPLPVSDTRVSLPFCARPPQPRE